MNSFIILSAILQCCIAQYGQKVAPGVPPQQYQQANYQQPPPPPPPQQQQQYQQQQFQQQQPQQFQQQQPPPQQFQQQPQQGQAPPSHHQGDPQLLNPQNIAHEREHIQEHMDVPIDTSKMSEQELQFHYFKMHDADNNNKLDGCELIKSLIHWHDQAGKKVEAKVVYTDQTLEQMIDGVFKHIDKNDDGYVDYSEYRQSF